MEGRRGGRRRRRGRRGGRRRRRGRRRHRAAGSDRFRSDRRGRGRRARALPPAPPAHACAVTGAGLAPGGQQAQPNKWPAFGNAKGSRRPGDVGRRLLEALPPFGSDVVRDAALVGPDLRSESRGQHRVAGPHVVGRRRDVRNI